jgi:rRNA maturation RNase YbeY|tara:strand:+ start:12828 stop:13238 length:411 start_codon:yes stop_codon:yes gene_type:complete
MISFNSNIDFKLKNKVKLKKWINNVIEKEGKKLNFVNFIFCDDNEMLEKNISYLNHMTYTDILTFDYTENNIISGDIIISIDRITENAKTYNVTFKKELKRVIIHGILHLIGYKDKSKKEKKIMREKEDFYLSLQL